MILTEEQKDHFQKIYRAVHDEYMQCDNLASIIGMVFPVDSDDPILTPLHEGVAPYLRARAYLGKQTMDLIYELERLIKEGEKLENSFTTEGTEDTEEK